MISLEVTFSSSTRTESTDYIYLYDGDGTQIGKYFSSQLTGETVTIPGNTLKIRLVTDEGTTYYGFSITDIKAVEQIYSGTDYPESEHPYAADMDQTWVYRSEGAKTLTVNFESSGIKTGDQFWVLTGSGAVAYYGKGSSGTVLFGLPDSVTVPGDTVRFRLKSGSAGGGSYGFKIASIVPGSTAPVVPEEDYLECDVVTFDDQYPESDHQYFGNTDKVWKYTCSGAGSLDVTFSSQTMVESNVDYIYLYDADQNQTGVYTGSALAGKTIHFNGSSFYIRLVTDDKNNYYGFGITNISASRTVLTSGYYQYTVNNGEATLVKYTLDQKSSLTLPSTIGGYPLTTIGSRAFEDSDITSLYGNSNIRRLEPYAFAGGWFCPTLIDLSMTKITEIPEYAFFFGSYGDTRTVRLPSTLKAIDAYGFYGCDGMESLELPVGLTRIGRRAFSGTYLKDIVLPATVTEIGASAFDTITNIPALPESMTYIPASYYSGSKIANAVISSNITRIENSAFSGCTALRSVSIPSSVVSIGDYVFGGCTALSSVSIPDSVTKIGEQLFYGCTGLENIALPKNMHSIPYRMFDDCSSLNDPQIPDSVSEIGSYAFSGSGLKSIVIPGSVKTVDYYAFYGCASLEQVVLENGVQTLGSNAFGNCSKLKSLTLPESIQSVGDYVLTGLEELCVLSRTFAPEYVSIFYVSSNLHRVYGYSGSAIEAWVRQVNEKFTDAAVRFIPLDGFDVSVQDGGAVLNRRTAGGRNLDLPEVLQGYPLKRIASGAIPAGTEQVVIPDSVSVIDNDAIPQGCVIVCSSASYACSWASQNGFDYTCSDWFTYTLHSGSAAIAKYTGKGTDVIVPAYLDHYAVTYIGTPGAPNDSSANMPFYWDDTLTGIAYPMALPAFATAVSGTAGS